MRLNWHEANGKGVALMVLKRDGKSFEGWWADDGSDDWSATWNLKKTSDTIGACPNWNPKAASANIVATELAAEGHARIYGINFDVDSDRLRAAAKPAVDKLLGALKAKPTWPDGIEGDRMTTAGLGQTKPVASNDTAIGRAQNRMVEVVKQ